MTSGWYNADGLFVKKHGDYEIDQPITANRARDVVVAGVKKQLVIEYDLTEIAAGAVSYPFDLNNDGTNDGFTKEEPFLPAGASVLSCDVYAKTGATGGTAIEVGTYQENGTAIDDNGFVTSTNGAIANMAAAGERAIGTGDLIADATGVVGLAQDSWVGIKATGTFTAGKGLIVIEYIVPTQPA